MRMSDLKCTFNTMRFYSILIALLLLQACSKATDSKSPHPQTTSNLNPKTPQTLPQQQLPIDCQLTATLKNHMPETLTFSLIKRHPHRENAFSQGLAYNNETLYESTGLYGQSQVSKINFNTHTVEQTLALSKQYFGEGLTLFKEELIQLTWKSGKVFRYQLPEIKRIKTQQIDGEGWGITYNGDQLITSNGSNRLTFRDPLSLEPTKEIEVSYLKRPLNKLNELEWVNGCILANIFMSDFIAVINPDNGVTTQIIDLKTLAKPERQRNQQFFTNGIAYRNDTGTLLVTGKNWQSLYEIQLARSEAKQSKVK